VQSKDLRQPAILSPQMHDVVAKFLHNPEFFLVRSSSNAPPSWTLSDTPIRMTSNYLLSL
jgi:hypothetical protein